MTLDTAGITFKFQSLLSWIGFKDVNVSATAKTSSGFQSLLSWIGFKDRNTGVDGVVFVGDVSILVVVDWVQRPWTVTFATALAATFQSLLSWIGFKDCSAPSVATANARSFNPCCRGLGSKT